MRKYNVVVAVGSALCGLLILYFGRNLTGFDENATPGENYWPFIIAWLLIGLGALQLFEVLARPRSDAEKTVDLVSRPVRMAYLSAVLCAVYGGLLMAFGFIAASVAFIPSMMALMGERRVGVAALVTIGVVGTIYVFFTMVFNTTLPTSVFLE